MRSAVLGIAMASLTMLTCSVVQARPVSYAGGWTLIEVANRASTAGLVHYSPAHNFSVGLRHEWQRADDVKLTAIQPTLLVKRWFGREYQGNFYLTGGLGTAKDESPNKLGSDTASFVGVMADWETRTLFVSYEARFLEQGALGNYSMHAARFGWAPYAGDTGELHTWLMLEVDRREHFEDKTSVTPLLRFFKGPALLELGYNLTDPSPLVNFTYRF
jgi:hypothetical protein